MQLEQVAAVVPWSELLSGGGIGVALGMGWLVLKYLKEQRVLELEESRRKDQTIAGITTEFSQTIRNVSADVKEGMAQMQETQVILLKDNREREAKLHELLREVRAS